jgi:hypothetical protein
VHYESRRRGRTALLVIEANGIRAQSEETKVSLCGSQRAGVDRRLFMRSVTREISGAVRRSPGTTDGTAGH